MWGLKSALGTKEQQRSSTHYHKGNIIAPFIHQYQLVELLPIEHTDGHRQIQEVQLTATGYRANILPHAGHQRLIVRAYSHANSGMFKQSCSSISVLLSEAFITVVP